MKPLHAELALLVRDVRQWIVAQFQPSPSSPKRKVAAPQLRQDASTSKNSASIESTERLPPPAQKTGEPKEKTESKTASNKDPAVAAQASKVEGWHLQPLPPLPVNSDLVAWKSKLSPFVTVSEPTIAALLIVTDEHPQQRLFLENVARAITRTFGPAQVISPQDPILQKKERRVILAPAPLLRKKFPEAQIDVLIKEENRFWIPMGDLDHYDHNIASKRALWTLIQLSFQSF